MCTEAWLKFNFEQTHSTDDVTERDDEKKFLLEEESSFHTIFTDTLNDFRATQLGGNYLLQTECPEDRVKIHGYRWRHQGH